MGDERREARRLLVWLATFLAGTVILAWHSGALGQPSFWLGAVGGLWVCFMTVVVSVSR